MDGGDSTHLDVLGLDVVARQLGRVDGRVRRSLQTRVRISAPEETFLQLRMDMKRERQGSVVILFKRFALSVSKAIGNVCSN